MRALAGYRRQCRETFHRRLAKAVSLREFPSGAGIAQASLLFYPPPPNNGHQPHLAALPARPCANFRLRYGKHFLRHESQRARFSPFAPASLRLCAPRAAGTQPESAWKKQRGRPPSRSVRDTAEAGLILRLSPSTPQPLRGPTV